MDNPLSRYRSQARGTRRGYRPWWPAAAAATVALAVAGTASAGGQASASAACAGAACTKGAWQILPVKSPVRASRAVLLDNGDVLLVAGSGDDADDFASGTLESAVYNPAKRTFSVIKTPDDFFKSGAVQLADGKVLILGGAKAYASATHDDEGLNTSYLFNPATDKYQRISNLNGGHWAPSATELGNGDVIAFGGLDQHGNGSTTTEYFKYDPDSPAAGRWLPLSQINEDHDFWGLSPAMVLTKNGELFYSGSHVLGDNETPVGATGTKRGQGGAGFLTISNITKPGAPDPTTTVTGLQDTPGGPPGTDMLDESMSVLLPPAQSQQVMLMGGGNINDDKPATRLTDLIDLAAAKPRYTPGPLLPLGTLSNGEPESAADGKMYVSTVLLPNGQVFETGGGLIRQAEPVYEAAMYTPATGKFAPVAADPVPRTYLSSAFLLPNGQVMAIGNNPVDGSFDSRISIYSPPYLFRGARPQVTAMATEYWTYGSAQQLTVSQKIVSAELIRPTAVAQSADPNQRYVRLPLTVTGNHVKLSVTSDPDIAPPGWYMLFVVDADGIPSVATRVHVSDVAANR
jgi:hypothetical protein